MLEYGPAKMEEEQALLDFVNMVFSISHEPTDFRVLLPRVYSRPGFSQLARVAREKGRILGAVSALTGTLALGEGTLTYGYIGNVAAHPYERGRGIMKRLMADTLMGLQEQGCHMAVLGGQRQRYQHFGFEDAGSTLSLYISQGSMSHVLAEPQGNFRFMPLGEGPESDLRRAHQLHQAGALVCRRKEEDFRDILRTWGGTACLVYQEEALAGYFYRHAGNIKEFAFFDPALAPAIFQAYMLQQGLEGLTVTLRPFELAVHQLLFACADSWEQRPACMLHVFNWPVFLEALLRFKASLSPLASGQRVLRVLGEGAFEITVTDKIVSVRETNLEADLSLDPLSAVRLATLPLNLHPGHPFMNWFPLPFDIPAADAF